MGTCAASHSRSCNAFVGMLLSASILLYGCFLFDAIPVSYGMTACLAEESLVVLIRMTI